MHVYNSCLNYSSILDLKSDDFQQLIVLILLTNANANQCNCLGKLQVGLIMY